MSELKFSSGNTTMSVGGIGYGTTWTIAVPKGIPKVKKVEFHNEMATVVYWDDGDITRVKVGEKDTFNPEYGYAMCIAKKVMGSYDRFAWSLSKAKHYNNGKKVKQMVRTEMTVEEFGKSIQKASEQLKENQIKSGFYRSK